MTSPTIQFDITDDEARHLFEEFRQMLLAKKEPRNAA